METLDTTRGVDGDDVDVGRTTRAERDGNYPDPIPDIPLNLMLEGRLALSAMETPEVAESPPDQSSGWKDDSR